MTNRYTSLVLYHLGDPDISQALLRCRDLVALVCQGLYPGADETGHEPDPELSFADPPASLLWWLSSLQVTLDSLYCHVIAAPSDPLATALQAYCSQHPEQVPRLRQVLVQANARDFTRWDDVEPWLHRQRAVPRMVSSSRYNHWAMSGQV